MIVVSKTMHRSLQNAHFILCLCFVLSLCCVHSHTHTHCRIFYLLADLHSIIWRIVLSLSRNERFVDFFTIFVFHLEIQTWTWTWLRWNRKRQSEMKTKSRKSRFLRLMFFSISLLKSFLWLCGVRAIAMWRKCNE